MGGQAAYHRVVVKISGEAFCARGGFGIDPAAVEHVVEEIAPLRDMDVQLGVVVGGGNIVRGRHLAGAPSIRRTTADYMGMLGTVVNALALGDALESEGMPARVLSALEMPKVCEPFTQRGAMQHLQDGRIVIFAGGTGSPFVTTDMCAALRASEMSAEALLKATKVEGVYDDDPVRQTGARKFDRLTYGEVLARRLGVMDLAAVSLCMDSHIPVVVFRLSDLGNLAAAVRGEPVGTVIASE